MVHEHEARGGFVGATDQRALEERVDELLERMTVAEKVAQISSVHAGSLETDGEFDEEKARDLLSDGIGHVTRIGGGAMLDPAAAAQFANDVQTFLRTETDCGIPAVPHEECLLGYMGPQGTIFPQSIGLASTWEPSLVGRITGEIATQLGSIGCHHALSPVVDLARDPRFGRTEETYGEDPYLVARMADGFVRGLQNNESPHPISATVKHFVGHGAPEGGRGRASLNIGERELRETHLFPFEVLVKETGVDAIMNAYNDVDGVPCPSSETLLTDVLRGEWGFDGVVVSDYHSIPRIQTVHGVADSFEDAAIKALEAGLDVELPERECYTADLVAAVEDGDLSESTIDRSVRRLLRQKLRKGLFEDTAVDPEEAPEHFDTDAQRTLAREAARKSTVLLENDDLLPLPTDLDSVAVLGPKADHERGLFGDYAHYARHEDEPIPFPVVTPLDGIRDAVGDDTRVAYAEGCSVVGDETGGFDEAVAAADDADVACVFVGCNSTIDTNDVDVDGLDSADVSSLSTSGEGNARAELTLPSVQRDLVESVAATGTPVVAVLVTGRPLALGDVVETADAVVHGWLPGEEGGNGLADVLFGEHCPSGRLPVSLPRSVGQVPVHYSRKSKSMNQGYVSEAATALYSFGHGLSYTEFTYEDPRVTPSEQGPAGRFEASVTVRNDGDRAGTETVQLYTHTSSPTRTRPVHELRGFERVELEPGERARVVFDLSTYQLSHHEEPGEPVVDPGQVEFRFAHSADDVRATATAEITGERKSVPADRQYFTRTRVE